jgi:hypothetical protein
MSIEGNAHEIQSFKTHTLLLQLLTCHCLVLYILTQYIVNGCVFIPVSRS